MKKAIYIALLLTPNLVMGQTNFSGLWGSHYDKANQLYDGRFYEEAIVYYEKEVDRYNFHKDSYLKIADCYRILGNYQKSWAYYNVVMMTSEVDDPIHKFYYAESLLSTGDYEEALDWYQEYSTENPQDPRPEKRMEGINNISSFFKDSASITIKPFFDNSEKTEFGAANYEDGIIFSSARSEDLVIQHDHLRQIESLLDLYLIKTTNDSIKEIIPIKLPRHWVSNDGPIAIGKEYVVITRNIGKRKDDVFNQLGLFFYEKDLINKPQLLEEFEYNSREYSNEHPALSSDADTLFFSSSMPGGFGGKDIYFSIKTNGAWRQPLNMGEKVNSAGDELWPFYENGVLYFSSNGHPGLGGLDIYKVNLTNNSSLPVNMGFPINTGWDDFSFNISDNEGYLASNRPGGLGHDDIYTFKIKRKPAAPVKKTNTQIRITDILNGKPVPYAEILLTNLGSNEAFHFTATVEGELNENFHEGHYRIEISASDYVNKEVIIDFKDKSLVAEEIFLEPELSLADINLDGIEFEYNDFRLTEGAEQELSHIISTMLKYDNIHLDIAAHTDSRGTTAYNHWLSEMRATHAANYLMEQGIDFERIKFAGYGEDELLNHCQDFVDCSEEEHAQNRRIEFKFVVDDK